MRKLILAFFWLFMFGSSRGNAQTTIEQYKQMSNNLPKIDLTAKFPVFFFVLENYVKKENCLNGVLYSSFSGGKPVYKVFEGYLIIDENYFLRAAKFLDARLTWNLLLLIGENNTFCDFKGNDSALMKIKVYDFALNAASELAENFNQCAVLKEAFLNFKSSIRNDDFAFKLIYELLEQRESFKRAKQLEVQCVEIKQNHGETNKYRKKTFGASAKDSVVRTAAKVNPPGTEANFKKNDSTIVAAERLELSAALKNIRIEADKYTDVTYYYSDRTPKDKEDVDRLFSYLVTSTKVKTPRFFLCFKHNALPNLNEEYLVIKRITLIADGVRYEINNIDKLVADNGKQHSAYYMMLAPRVEWYTIYKKIIESETVEVRFWSANRAKDFVVSNREKKALKDVLVLYESMTH